MAMHTEEEHCILQFSREAVLAWSTVFCDYPGSSVHMYSIYKGYTTLFFFLQAIIIGVSMSEPPYL